VANIPIKTRQNHLKKLFQHYGHIKTIRLRSQTGEKVYNKLDRKRSGSLNAYIVFDEIKSAEKSVEMNNKEHNGNRIRVNMANEKRTFEKTKGTVFVGNLAFGESTKNKQLTIKF
jgi:nucleolar protein 12